MSTTEYVFRRYVLPVLERLRREPVMVAASLVAAVVIGVSAYTGEPVEAILARGLAVWAVFREVRERVTPLVDEVWEDHAETYEPQHAEEA